LNCTYVFFVLFGFGFGFGCGQVDASQLLFVVLVAPFGLPPPPTRGRVVHVRMRRTAL
jgi:hypothetical protein